MDMQHHHVILNGIHSSYEPSNEALIQWPKIWIKWGDDYVNTASINVLMNVTTKFNRKVEVVFYRVNVETVILNW